jgi:hypothetical protein
LAFLGGFFLPFMALAKREGGDDRQPNRSQITDAEKMIVFPFEEGLSLAQYIELESKKEATFQ